MCLDLHGFAHYYSDYHYCSCCCYYYYYFFFTIIVVIITIIIIIIIIIIILIIITITIIINVVILVMLLLFYKLMCWHLNPLSPKQWSVCKFSLYYPHKIDCLVMRIKQMIIQNNWSEMENKTLPNCLQWNYRDSLGTFSSAVYGVFRAIKSYRKHFSCCCWCCRAVEDEVFNTAMSLAERYQVPRWDMFMAHLEWLFTDTEWVAFL